MILNCISLLYIMYVISSTILEKNIEQEVLTYIH